MDQKKINYLIGGVVVLLVVILGVYYYQNIPKQVGENTIPVPENIIDESGTFLPPESSSLDKGRSGGVVSELTSAEIKAKFNTAMDNARLAFRNKDYPQAIIYYKQALTYQNTDTPYSGLFYVYGAQKEWTKALEALNSAIKINPLFVDYWISKIGVLNEKTNASFQDLQKVYNEGLTKIDPARKIDLITYFATVAENNGQKAEAIALWESAIKTFPENGSIYQAEIDRLSR